MTFAKIVIARSRPRRVMAVVEDRYAEDERDLAQLERGVLMNAAGVGVAVIDSGFDETFPFFGRVLPYSIGYAKLRGLWVRSQKLPVAAGQVVVTGTVQPSMEGSPVKTVKVNGVNPGFYPPNTLLVLRCR